MNEPLVSVVVPVYRVEDYLDRCVMSIVKQTYTNIEIILVDDGSPDGCPALCDAWAEKDSRIKVVHKQNAGAGMARNTGIDNACGEYICFFDSDDYVDSTIVEKCVTSALANNADTVLFGRNEAYSDGRVSKKEITIEKALFCGDEVIGDLLPSMYNYKYGFGISVWGKMYRLSLIKDNNLRFLSERELGSEDAYFTLELFSKVKRAAVVRENLYYYFNRTGSLSRAYDDKRQKQNDALLCACVKYIREHGLPKTVESHVMARYHYYTIAAMKQLVSSSLPNREKLSVLRAVYKSEALRGTLRKDVFDVEKKSVATFFRFVKIRCYFMSDLMLKLKASR